MPHKFIKSTLFSILALIALNAHATTVVLQEGVSGYSGTTDTNTFQDFTTTNYGSETTVKTQARFATHKQTGWIKFDLTEGASGIPSNAVVSSATFSAKYAGSCNDAITIYAYRAFKPWVESTMTWNVWDTNLEWGSGGGLSASDAGVDNSGDGTGSDTTATAEGSVAINECAATFHDITVTTAVQNWIDGTWNNNGLFVKPADGATGTDSFNFYSSENATSSDRPYLTVIYTVPESGGGGSTWNGSLNGTLN